MGFLSFFKRFKKEEFALPPSIQTINYSDYTRKLVNIPVICTSAEERIELLVNRIFIPWFNKNVHPPPETPVKKHNYILDDFCSNHNIPIEKYGEFLLRAANLSNFIRDNIEPIFISSLVYINRLHHLYIDTSQIFYLFIISFCLSIKYNYDPLDNIWVSNIITHLFHIKMREKYRLLEQQFLEHLNYNLFVPTDLYISFYNQLL